MKIIGSICLAMLTASTLSLAQKKYQPTAEAVAYVHANIVNVIKGKIDPDQVVLVDSNRIIAVGPAKKINIPSTIRQVDVTGRYLMPGMVDAHIHFFQSGGLYTRPDGLNLNAVYSYSKDQQWIKDHLDQLLARYLACGITTVIDVGGPLSNYSIRDKANASSKAPNALVTGPLISTYLPQNLDTKDPPIIKVNSPDEARDLVRRQLPYHPDFIKIWYIVLPSQKAENNLPIIKAAIEESHANGLKVAVHATEYETAKNAVEAGADILVHSVDDKLLDEPMLQLLKNKSIVYIPTLVVAQGYSRTFTQQFDFNLHDLRYSDPFMLGSLMDLQHIPKGKIPFDYRKMRNRLLVPSKEDSTMLRNLKLASDYGISIVSGTDAGNIGTQHAASYLDELYAMKKAGLSNWDILKSATIQAALGFGKGKEFGSIEQGKFADMLMLSRNPIEDLSVLEHIDTIIHKGKEYSPENLLPADPETLVQQQLNAYNVKNIDAFLEPYADDVELYHFPGKLIAKGKDKMKESYKGMFQSAQNLHCEITERIVQGNTVIDHESVSGLGQTPVKAIAIYTIENNKITKVYFIQ